MSQQDHPGYSPSQARFPSYTNQSDGRPQHESDNQRIQLPFPPQQREALPSLQQLQTMAAQHTQQPSYALQSTIPPPPPPHMDSVFNVPQSTFSRHRQGPIPASLPNLSRLEAPYSATAYSPQFSPSHAHSPSASSFSSQPGSAMHPGGLPPSAGSIKGKRKRANPQQLSLLNQLFDMTFFPSTELRNAIGKELGMAPRTVQIWFQNRRQSWRAQKNRTGDAAATGASGEAVEPRSNDNERGGWEVLRAFQAKKANGEIGDYDCVNAQGAPAAAAGQSGDQHKLQSAGTSQNQASLISGLTSPGPASTHEMDTRWSSLSEYGSSAPSSAGYLHHRSGSISSAQGAGTFPYGLASPRMPSTGQQAWPRQPLSPGGSGTHNRALSGLDLGMQAPPPPPLLPYRPPQSPSASSYPGLFNFAAPQSGVPSYTGQEDRQGYDYSRFGGLPPPPSSSTAFGRG